MQGTGVTLIFGLPFGLLVGSSLALIARRRGGRDNSLWLHPTHLCAWLFALALFTPAALYPLLRYPDWSLMYVISGAQFTLGSRVAIALLPALAVVIGALGCRAMMVRELRFGTPAAVALTAAASTAVAVWGYDRLWRVGSIGSYHGEARKLMPVLADSRLGLALLFTWVALLGVWIYTLLLLRSQYRVSVR
ncbi:MAG: hypothetical protein JXR83_19690 [Deltaproteobacteria bacterium]|nr:hypothetical protein [Deltaproteobacteria bacterium]